MGFRTAAAASALVLAAGLALVALRTSPDVADGGPAPAAQAPAPLSPRIARAGGRCDRVATPRDRRARGTVAGAAELVRRLRPGQTGCLRPGRYAEDVTVTTSGIALRSLPGARRAELAGRLWIRGDAHDVTIARLRLDGRNARRLPSPTVNGDRAVFSRVTVTNHHTAICFVVGGTARYGRAQGTVIRFSRIHDCGVLPSRNLDHGIYVSAADDTRILGNLIYDNADRGIQLYPDAQRTLIVGNVIDGNGEGIIFSGVGPETSRDNVVRHNVISNSRIRANVESFYPPGTPAGTGNLVTRNCLFGGHGRLRLEPGGLGFAARANVYADPRFADRARGDFRVAPSSPCAPLLRAGRAAARRAAG